MRTWEERESHGTENAASGRLAARAGQLCQCPSEGAPETRQCPAPRRGAARAPELAGPAQGHGAEPTAGFRSGAGA